MSPPPPCPGGPTHTFHKSGLPAQLERRTSEHTARKRSPRKESWQLRRLPARNRAFALSGSLLESFDRLAARRNCKTWRPDEAQRLVQRTSP